jgi:hypothetical protein
VALPSKQRSALLLRVADSGIMVGLEASDQQIINRRKHSTGHCVIISNSSNQGDDASRQSQSVISAEAVGTSYLGACKPNREAAPRATPECLAKTKTRSVFVHSVVWILYYLDSSFGVESNGMGSCCVAGHWEGYIINKKRHFPHNPTAAGERPPQQRKRSAVASSPPDK